MINLNELRSSDKLNTTTVIGGSEIVSLIRNQFATMDLLIAAMRVMVENAKREHHSFSHDYVSQERKCISCRYIKSWEAVLSDFEKAAAVFKESASKRMRRLT